MLNDMLNINHHEIDTTNAVDIARVDKEASRTGR